MTQAEAIAEVKRLRGEAFHYRKAMRLALKHIDKEQWNWAAGTLSRALGYLPPLAANKVHDREQDGNV